MINVFSWRMKGSFLKKLWRRVVGGSETLNLIPSELMRSKFSPWRAGEVDVPSVRPASEWTFLKYSVLVLVFKRCYGSVRYDKGLTLEMPASLSLHGGNLTLINLFDTKLHVRITINCLIPFDLGYGNQERLKIANLLSFLVSRFVGKFVGFRAKILLNLQSKKKKKILTKAIIARATFTTQMKG